MPGSFGGRLAFPGGDVAASYVDLGSEPPLTVGSPSVGVPARRAVSVRWLSGTILTGFTAFVLMGGALNIALNGQQLAAVPPSSTDFGAAGNHVPIGQKGDRIMPVAAPPATREIIPVAVTIREGDRELIQQRDYAFINTTLAAADPEGLAIPVYDPIAIVGEAAANNDPVAAPPAEAGAFADGDIDGGNAAIRTTAFPLGAPVAPGPDIGTAAINEIVRANGALFAGGAETWPTLLAYANAGGFGFETETPVNLRIRSVPENVSYLTKSAQGGLSRDERVVPVEPGVPLGDLLADAGVAEADVTATMAVMDALIDLAALTAAHRVRIAMVPAAEGTGAPQLLRVSIYEDDVHQATVARDDAGIFVRADEPGPLPDGAEAGMVVVSTGGMPTLYEALYRTGVDQGLSEGQINELVGIFAFDVDMNARIGPADALQLFHSMPADGSPGATDQDPILYASLTLSGVTTSYYRFQTDDGVVKYYGPDGRSADNFLLRKPMSGGEFRSGFGYRTHPILGGVRFHSGVDWSAPRGTPIVAAGDGTVITMETTYQSGGYGNYTVIQHANGYETAYAHQNAFAEGLTVGSRVVQGQVIGYVGTTGLSTGNHLHYEVRINGQAVNPLTIRLPEGRVLSASELAVFEQLRDQINGLLGITLDVAATN